MKLHQVVLPALLIAAISCTDDNAPHDQGCGAGIVFGVTEARSPQSRAACDSTDYTLTLSSDTDSCRLDATATVTDMCDEAPQSRGTMASGIDAIKEFSIYSFYYPSSTAASRPFFADEQAQKQGDYWTTSTLYYWPTTDGSTLDFWALAGGPNLPGVTVLPSVTSASTMTIDYIVPASAALQTDLMVATTDPINTPGTRVPLNFRHICSAVKFVIGDLMQPGTIKEIRLSGIMSHGQYASTWSSLGTPATFILSPNKVTTSLPEDVGSAIVGDAYTLMMLPQTLGADAQLTVVFHDDVTGEDRTLTSSLAGRTWPQGKVTTYRIGISKQYDLNISAVETQDAHYVICNSEISIEGLPAGKSWTLTASASDGADVSVQLTSEVNEYVKQGFWTDKTMTNGVTINNESARGGKTITGIGSGNFPITIFLPENITDSNRIVTLSVNADGAPQSSAVTRQITQLCPVWDGTSGWEQINDNQSGNYGFEYEAKHVYVYNNSEGTLTISRVERQTKNLINQYSANDYASVSRYSTGILQFRVYVLVDYTKLNVLGEEYQSVENGLENTRNLFKRGGTALTNNFESALRNMTRVLDSSKKAYEPKNERNPSSDPVDVPAWVDGYPALISSGILVNVLKKNKYYLNTSTGEGLTTTTALIREQDIEWYIPAKGQFPGTPNWFDGSAVNLEDYWSSTAADGTNAYLGNGNLEERKTTKFIRVMRNRP